MKHPRWPAQGRQSVLDEHARRAPARSKSRAFSAAMRASIVWKARFCAAEASSRA
ncbi:MAG: hypothetical protein U0229_08270 [Anaeromyxobacter sp.]